MVQTGVLYLCKYGRNYDPSRPNANVFAFLSQIVWNAFIQFIKKEKRQLLLKQTLAEQSKALFKRELYQVDTFDEDDDEDE